MTTLFDELTEPAKPARITKKPATMAAGHSDSFQTASPWVVDILRPFIQPDWRIWEPAAGEGRLVGHLKAAGYAVVASELLDATPAPMPCRWFAGKDYFEWTPEDVGVHWDCSFANPPFSVKDAWIERSYELGKPFALILPLTTFEGRRRQSLFRRYGVEVIIPHRRIDFTTPIQKKTGGAYFMSALFTWGFGVGQALTFWEPEG